MINKQYRETVQKMESSKVDPDYILGWEGGYLGHPQRESQRVSDAYTAGYEHGQDKDSDSYSDWAKN